MTRLTRKQAADDARRSYDEAVAALREKHIRAHAIRPREGNETEQRFWDEGPARPANENDELERPFDG